FALPVAARCSCQRQRGHQWPRAGIGMDLELTIRIGLGAHDSVLGLVAVTPCHTTDGQRDALGAFNRRAVPLPAHVADIRLINGPRTLCWPVAVQARSRLT